jgi:glycine/D-amino acid oxidase-like deaminating enzyme
LTSRGPTVRDLATRSYWLGLDPYEPDLAFEGELQADITIVGGGFSGLWTAWHLLEADPGLTVVVIEASAVGYGASGRNGGFAMTLLHRGLKDLVGAVGEEQARALHRGAVDSIRSIGRVCEKQAIAADLQPNGLLTVSNSPLQDAVVHDEFETAQKLGLGGIAFLDGDAIRANVHSETFRCAVYEDACTLLNPARLVRGLKEAVIRAGGRVFEQTPMERLDDSGDPLRVVTPKGVIHARRVLLAANAYSVRLPSLRSWLMPFYSYILLSEPLSDEQWSRIGWEGREAMEDRRTFLHYMRPTIDGRLMWAGRDAPYRPNGPDPKYDRDDRVFRRLEETFAWTFPQLGDVRFEHRWGGPIAITGRFLPAAGWLEEGRVAYAFGYAGHGVAISHLVSQGLRDLLLERDTDATRLALIGRQPPALGPRLLRDPLVHLNNLAALRRDDAGDGAARAPLLLRLFDKLGQG